MQAELIDSGAQLRAMRHALGMNQQDFWAQVGVTQSGGSRYESGRSMPRAVRELVRLVHVEQIDLRHIRKEHFEIVEYLKNADPELYRNLRRSARATARTTTRRNTGTRRGR